MDFLCKKYFLTRKLLHIQNSKMHDKIPLLFKENVGHFIQFFHVKFVRQPFDVSIPWSSPSVITFSSTSEFSYKITRFLPYNSIV